MYGKLQQQLQTELSNIKEEGLLIGGSSGGAVWAALQVAHTLHSGENCLVILPDSIRNYLSKFIDDQWMSDNKF